MKGFKIESGSRLSPKLQGLTGWFLDYLKKGRETNTITPAFPVYAIDVVRAIQKEKGIRLDDSEIQALTNFWRRQYEPIATGGKGYFYATQRQELDGTIQHLKHRIAGTQIALDCVLEAQSRIQKGQKELFG